MPFVQDLEFGEDCEREIGGFLAKGSRVRYSKGNFKDWDYKIGGKTYEQKTDRLTKTTGNICVELTINGEPAGILSSKADYWVSYPLDMGEIAVVPRLEMARLTKEKSVKTLNCGDNNAGLCMLVPWKSIPNHYKIKYAKCLL
jgi:hypothetical protein